MRRNFYYGILIVTVCIFMGAPLSAAIQDYCSKEGITVRNMTMLNLWYRENGGNCVMWKSNYMFRIKPEDTVEIFSDLVCSRLYCDDNPDYKRYKSLDANGNCRVRILPRCNLSDM